ncbi:MAG: hypothetical protein MUO51_13820, partial [Woeseiaceae bacterium]|nr:hypothetical protein [Woeseiaceae bacterium]
MIGDRTPRLLLLAVALGIAVAGIMLSVFYGQYQWLARQLVETSAAEYDEVVRGSFERSARSQLHAAADRLGEAVKNDQGKGILVELNAVLVENENLTGVRYSSLDGQTYSAGSYP